MAKAQSFSKKKITLIVISTFLILAIVAICVLFAINSRYIYEPVHADQILKDGEMGEVIIEYNGAAGKPEKETIQAEAHSYVQLPQVEKEGYIFLCWFCNYVIVWDNQLYVNAKQTRAIAQFEKDYSMVTTPVATFSSATSYKEYNVGEYPSIDEEVKDIYVEGSYAVDVYSKKNFKGKKTTIAYKGTYSGKVGSMKIRQVSVNKEEVFSLDDNTKASLLTKYAPKLWWDEKEKYYASSVEFALENLDRELSPDGYMLYLKDLNKPNYECEYFYGDKENMKGYAFAVEKEYEYLDLCYYFFFPFNKAKSVFGIPFGNHVGDWEHMIVRLRIYNEDGKIYYAPVLAQYSIHSQRIYLPWDEVPEFEDTHPVGYIARGSHGIWPKEGKNVYVDKVIVKLSDICSKGEAWNLWDGDNLETFKYDAINHTGDGIGSSQWKSCFNRDFYNPDSDASIRWGNYGFNYPIEIYPQLQNAPECPVDKKGVCDYYCIDSRFYY